MKKSNKLKFPFETFLNKHYRFYKDSSFYWVLFTFVGSIFLMFFSNWERLQSGYILSDRDAQIGVFGFFLAFVVVSGLSLLCSLILSLISVIFDSRAKKEVSQDD